LSFLTEKTKLDEIYRKLKQLCKKQGWQNHSLILPALHKTKIDSISVELVCKPGFEFVDLDADLLHGVAFPDGDALVFE